MNDDNDEARRAVEHCYRTQKTMVNPIVDWTDDDVWNFLNSNNIPHCCLYDEGFKRLGCIGCPMSGKKNMERDFERWPKYKEMYIRAFEHMIENHPGEIKILDPNAETKFKLDMEDDSSGGGCNGFGIGANGADEDNSGGIVSTGQNAGNPHNSKRERERERERVQCGPTSGQPARPCNGISADGRIPDGGGYRILLFFLNNCNR